MENDKAEMTHGVNDGGELCQRCGEKGEDRRTLRMDCFYNMLELGLPFGLEVFIQPEASQLTRAITPGEITLTTGEKIRITPGQVTMDGPAPVKQFYTLRVCKDCRGDWMLGIKKWFEEEIVRESCGSGIFVRRNGRNVEITEEEWYKDNPGREPLRIPKSG